jgi:hypothetical protein
MARAVNNCFAGPASEEVATVLTVVALRHSVWPPIRPTAARIVLEEGAMASMRDSVSVDGATMKLYLSMPDGAAPFPAAFFAKHLRGLAVPAAAAR